MSATLQMARPTITSTPVRQHESEAERRAERLRRRRAFVPVPRPLRDVCRDVLAWQDDLLAGRDLGPMPIGVNGYPLTHDAARRFFGQDVRAFEHCRLRAR